MSAGRFAADSVPRLGRGVRLKDDKARGQWVLLAPERVIVPDATALEVLQRIDGARTVGDIVDALAAEFDAPADVIRADVLAMLEDLAEKGFVTS